MIHDADTQRARTYKCEFLKKRKRARAIRARYCCSKEVDGSDLSEASRSFRDVTRHACPSTRGHHRVRFALTTTSRIAGSSSDPPSSPCLDLRALDSAPLWTDGASGTMLAIQVDR